MEKIDLNKIRGNYVDLDEKGTIVAGGDDTIESIKLVVEKVNELIEHINNLTE